MESDAGRGCDRLTDSSPHFLQHLLLHLWALGRQLFLGCQLLLQELGWAPGCQLFLLAAGSHCLESWLGRQLFLQELLGRLHCCLESQQQRC